MNEPALKLNILFIEDNADDAELAIRALRKDGIDADWRLVDNERNLVEMLESWTPDIILSDYSMPAFSGIAALPICRERMPNTPFIFLSATIGEERAIESILKGATDYVLKDNLRRLSTSVRRAVDDAINRQRALEVEKERSRLIAILETTSDVVGIALPDESILYLNRSGKRLLGVGEDFSGLTLEAIHSRQHWKFIRNGFFHQGGPRDTWKNDSLLVALDGTEIPVSHALISHRNASKEVEYYSFIARDLRDHKAFEKRIDYLANFDALTEMPNRSRLAERIGTAITHAHVTKRSLAILIIDIDRFKLINDAYGHDFGDQVLCSLANRLRNSLGGNETIARLNADSFAILATEMRSPEDTILLVNTLLSNLTGSYDINGQPISLTVGIGVSVFPRDGNDANTLLRNAGTALHRLKEKGVGNFQFYTAEMTDSASARVLLEADLHHALENNELLLHYQPQIDLRSGTITGIEALMRWHHPVRGMIAPGQFIPIAECSDLICAMGDWALLTACRQLKQWETPTGRKLRIAVNISPRQFRSADFVGVVKRTLATANLDPSQLELEITESILVQDQEEVGAILEELNVHGVRISLDDFGTGYSSLSYLSRLPIHTLKIDQSFVRRSLEDKNDREIVRAVISLAESLELNVIAEGIESPQHLALLREYDCSEGQGYYFHKPLPAADITQLLHSQNPGRNAT